MTDLTEPTCWVFNGAGAPFPGGVFLSRAAAHDWIEKHRLTGVLTDYPVDRGVYDWAIAKGYFKPKKPAHASSAFIGAFSDASQPHYHYVDGVTRD